MARNIVKAKLDIIFKKLFTDEGNQHILQAFLSDILEIPYESINNIIVLNSEIMPENIIEKYSRMDIKMTVDGLSMLKCRLKTRAITRIVQCTTFQSCTAISLKAVMATENSISVFQSMY